MKIALVSDIHANLQAWKAVLLDIRSVRADMLICLGDVVGYGPNPAEVVASVSANANCCLLGNHDAALCGKIGDNTFSETAARSLAWTKARLGNKAAHYLSLLPLTIAAGGFRCAHGEFGFPGGFRYVFEPQDAFPSWSAVSERLLFVGHTHQPGIFVIGKSRAPHRIPPQDFALEDGKRYLVNVGSVGQPRDGDTRAGYCLYDVEGAAVYWRRIPFDLDAFRDALRRAGIPESEHVFLRHDPLAGQPSARELAGFRPSDKPEDGARDAVPVQNVELLLRRAGRWRKTAWLLMGLCVLAGLALAWLWFVKISHPAEIRSVRQAPLRAAAQVKGGNLLRLPGASAEPGAPIEGWTIRLADSLRQAVVLNRESSAEPVFEMRSEIPDGEITIASDPVSVARGMKLVMEGAFRKSPEFSGYVVMTAKLFHRDAAGADPSGYSSSMIVKEPNLARQGGWRALKHTFSVPADVERIAIQVGGKFTGRVEAKSLALTWKE